MKKLILSLAFISLGTFAMAQQSPNNFENKRQEKQEKHLQKMQKELGLNDAQVAKIRDLGNREMTQQKSEIQNLKSDRKARMKSREAEMNNILTTDQYNKWKAYKDVKKAEMMEKRKNGKRMRMQNSTN